MADEKPQDNKPQDPPATPPTLPADDKYAALEKKFGDLSNELGGYREIMDGMAVVANTMASSPELRDAFQAQLRKNYGLVSPGEGAGQQPPQNPTPHPTPPSPAPANDKLTSQVNDVVASQREAIVADFERTYGIDQMRDEDKKEARRVVESHFNKWGWSVKTAPLASLRASLDDAYVSTHAEKLREEGKLEGFAQARNNSMGYMGTFSGTAPQTQENPNQLTSGQVEWAKKLGVDPKAAQETYANRDNEAERIPPVEKNAAK